MYWKVCQKSKVLLIRVVGLKGKKRSFGKDVAVGSKMDLVLWALAQQKLWFRTPSNTCRKHLAARKAWGETLVFQRVPERWSSWVRPLRIAWWQIPKPSRAFAHLTVHILLYLLAFGSRSRLLRVLKCQNYSHSLAPRKRLWFCCDSLRDGALGRPAAPGERGNAVVWLKDDLMWVFIFISTHLHTK